MRYFAEQKGIADKISISSRGTSREELGNPVHCEIARRLKSLGISVTGKYAKQFGIEDYINNDMIICMESYNISNLNRIIGNDRDKKVSLLMEYTGCKRDVADPYYSGNFDDAWSDIYLGCSGLLDYIIKERL